MRKKILVALIIISSIFSVSAITVRAQDSYGISEAAKNTGLERFKTQKGDLFGLIGDIISIGLSLLGVVFFLLILYAGFTWMTAFGSSEKVDKAKEIMQAAILGLLIVLAAYAVTRFVFEGLGVGSGGA